MDSCSLCFTLQVLCRKESYNRYVLGKTVDNLFEQASKEEANIRANPLVRTSDILKKVFGGN